MSYFAQVDGDTVVRVVVCDDPAWLESRLGGTWVETGDPYAEGEVAYAGPGHGYAPSSPRRFAPPWQPGQAERYGPGAVAFHGGQLWQSERVNNSSEPGGPGWVQA